MSRIIKFRAWDDINKEMVYSRYAPFNSIHDGDILKKYETVMQFTGLKDMEGTDIYEGDILKTRRGDWGIVVSKDHCFELTVAKDQSSLYTKEFYQECKIIGNIHQQPEHLQSTLQ